MPRVALRLVLVLCLVLNGIGNAMAAVAMPARIGGMPQHMAMAADPPAPPQAASTCDHADADTMPAVAVEVSVSKPPHPADCDQDCCSRGACHCPDMQWAHAALLDVPAVPALPGCSRVASVFPAVHPAPLLHDVIRPPIG